MSDITDKLRAIYPKYHNLNEWDVRYEAADTIEALRAENARLLKLYDGGVTHWKNVLDKMEAENLRLREALKPFADVPLDGYEYSSALLRTADLRAARAAMGDEG